MDVWILATIMLFGLPLAMAFIAWFEQHTGPRVSNEQSDSVLWRDEPVTESAREMSRQTYQVHARR
jgi:hypothetical protein